MNRSVAKASSGRVHPRVPTAPRLIPREPRVHPVPACGSLPSPTPSVCTGFLAGLNNPIDATRLLTGIMQ